MKKKKRRWVNEEERKKLISRLRYVFDKKILSLRLQQDIMDIIHKYLNGESAELNKEETK